MNPSSQSSTESPASENRSYLVGANAGRLGLLTLTCLVVANMIGAGVYTTSGYALGSLQTPGNVMWVWCIAGLFALLGAVCYGGLAKRVAASGGEYLFLSRAFHPFAGFMAGWISLTAGFSGAIAVSALAFDAYLGTDPWQIAGVRIVPLSLIITFGVLHLIGLAFGSAIQNVLVLSKMIALLGFVGYASLYVNQPYAESTSTRTTEESGAGPESSQSSNVDPNIIDPPAENLVDAAESQAIEPQESSGAALPVGITLATFATQLMWISFSYAGYNAAVYVAGATTGPNTVARSMWLAALVVTLVYLGLNGVVVYGVPTSELVNEQEVFRIAATYLCGPTVGWIVSGIILLSLATSVSAMLQAGPHVYAQMARDGVLPKFLAGEASEIPRAATILQILLACGMTVWTSLPDLLQYVAFLLMLSSAFTVATLLVPRRFWREPHASDVHQVIGWPVTPVVFVIFSLVTAGLALKFRWETNENGQLFIALAVVPLGAILYPCIRAWNARTATQNDQMLES